MEQITPSFLCLMTMWLLHLATHTAHQKYQAILLPAIWWPSIGHYHLSQNPRYSKLSDAETIGLLLVPGLIGGFPIIYLHNMFVRAESDLLSPYIGLTHFSQRYYPDIAGHMAAFGCVTLIPIARGFLGLLIDPYSLPLFKPTAPCTVLRRSIEKPLRRIVRNEQIRKLFKMKDRGVSTYIIEKLREANVYNARVFAAVFAASPEGLISELLRKFETGRSVLEVLILASGKRHGIQVLRNVLRADIKIQRYRLDRLKHRGNTTNDLFAEISQIHCPQEAAQYVRDHWWGKHIESVTMPPVQHLVHLEPQQGGHLNGWEDRNHFQYKTSEITQHLDAFRLPSYASSGLQPFIGYTTRNSMIPARINFIEKNILLSKVKDLIDLISWTNYTAEDWEGNERTSNFVDCIKYLLTLYLEVSPDRILGFRASRKSGTISHHVRAPNFRESIVPNVLSNVYQQISADSSSHQTLRGSGVHLQVNFLHILCHCTTLLTLPCMTGNRMGPRPQWYWVVTDPCSYCMTPIVESPIVLPPFTDAPDIDDLRVSEISPDALRIVNESIRQSKIALQQDVRVPDYLTDDFAMYAIVQEFMYTTFTKRMRLLDCYVHQGVSNEGYAVLQGLVNTGHSRNIGITEMARVQVRTLTQVIAICVYDFIVEQSRSLLKDEMYTYLGTQRAQNLPWFFLCEQLQASDVSTCIGVCITVFGWRAMNWANSFVQVKGEEEECMEDFKSAMGCI